VAGSRQFGGLVLFGVGENEYRTVEPPSKTRFLLFLTRLVPPLACFLKNATPDGMIRPMNNHRLIAASILASDFSRLREQIEEAENAGSDWIHIDVMDGHFVPNLTMGPVIVRACRHSTSLPLDVHLMVSEPDGLLKAFADAGATSMVVHFEACTQLYRTLQSIRDLGVKPGVALNPATPAHSVSEVLPVVDSVLVMTTNPGFSGGVFIPTMLEKVSELDALRKERASSALLEVDGGIDPSTAPLAVKAGADVFVAATAIFGNPDGIRSGVDSLRQSMAEVISA
jgi:ribulose-phosphate 3-epimerase